jgi:hypothetical protein
MHLSLTTLGMFVSATEPESTGAGAVVFVATISVFSLSTSKKGQIAIKGKEKKKENSMRERFARK